MKACILLGNTRQESNTETIAGVFADELVRKGFEVKLFRLREKDIRPCVGCDTCHGVTDAFGCVQNDDMHEIAAEILTTDLLVFSTPIYNWGPTPPLKAVMDRMYAFTKFPEGKDEFNLMKNQRLAVITSSGDECKSNCDLLDETVRRMAKFAGLEYLGYFAAQDKGRDYIHGEEVTSGAKAFAERCALLKTDGRIQGHNMRDNLTGLYDRTFFNAELERVRQEDIVNFGFIMADLNGLKLINNTFGHQKGDEMIVEAAQILKDICGEKGEVIRIGGGEFAIFVYDCKQEDLERLCADIKNACSKYSDRIIPLSISCGISLRQEVGHSVRVLYRQAEGSMYSSKLLENNSAQNQVMTSLTEMLRARSPDIAEHAKRVVIIAAIMGKKLELTSAEYDKLLLLALMHDIGVIAIPDNIMHKPMSLDEEEWRVMRTHCEVGCRIAMASNELSFIANEICCHHERWDGAGYPYGYEGEQIPLLSRIINVVDSFEALTNERVYKDAVKRGEAYAELKKTAGAQHDPGIVKIFMELFENLSDDEMNALYSGDADSHIH